MDILLCYANFNTILKQSQIKELDNRIKELKDKLYDIEFQGLVNEEKKHTGLEG